jgi:mRNA-degrading endonuclease YafQ of YafQ-DinJ toxin-antitoxin module
MDVRFSDTFVDSVKKHASLKSAVQKKVDMIMANPVRMGEPLKGNFRGYYSCPVKKNFIIIYLYCLSCRRKKDQEIVLCHDCHACEDETIKFIALGPHDKAYRKFPVLEK